jgi:signal transduction histidine kinase
MPLPSDTTDRIDHRSPQDPPTGVEANEQTSDLTPPKDLLGYTRASGSISPLQWVLPPGKELTFEEIRKRRLFAGLCIPGMMVLGTFGFYHLFHGNFLEGSLDLFTGLWLMFSLLGLRLLKKGLVIYRINTTLLGLLMLFLAVRGGVEGNKLLWMFSYPLIVFYSLGIREGLAWTGVVYALCMGILFGPWETPWVHHYSLEFKIRFGAAFAFIASITYIYESARGKYQSSFEDEQRNLEAEKLKLTQMTHMVQGTNRALAQSEQRLKQAQSIARVGNFEYDPETDHLWGSEEALRILGLDRVGSRLSLGDLKIQAPDFHAFIEGFGSRRRDTCKFRLKLPGPGEMAYQEKVMYARAELAMASEAGSAKIIGVVQDITALHKAEAEKKELKDKLVRSQKMEALGLLAGGVAHDLNNVLSGIVSYPDMLLMRLPDDSDLRKPLSVMRDSGQKAAAIVQDLLTLARRGVISVEVLNFNDLVDQYLASPEFHKLQSYHPQVAFEVDKEDRLSNIEASPVHMKKTLMNLVSNAAEALPKGGRVLISTRNQRIDKPLKGYTDIKPGEYVVLGVEDNGSGILREDLGKIFEPFFTKKKMGRSGTGLGLAVVWGTVHDNNGCIDVSTASDKGTRIEIYLPTTTENMAPQDEEIPSETYRGTGETILVVDDIQSQRDITREMLTILGYHVEMADSGEAAIAFLEDHHVDLVLLDMIMPPGMDGLETYTRLRSFRPAQKTLIVSGYSETARVRKAQKLGAGAYVKKPFDIHTIGMAIRRELDK